MARVSRVIDWLEKIENYSSNGKNEELVKSLCSLCVLLRVYTFSPVVQMKIVSRLMPLLLHENTNVLRSTLSIIIVLTEDSSFPPEITMALMEQAENMLHSGGDKLTLVCEMLTYLTNEKTTHMLCSSGCLRSILTIFSNTDVFENPLENINWIVNILICSISAETRIMIVEEVIPKVVGFLNMWLDDPDAARTPVLKELLFLARCATSCFEEGQNMFLQNGGLQSLISALKKTDTMKDHLEIVVHTRNCLHLDYSPTLFSSLVILLDVTVTHNRKACQVAVHLDATEILQQYLDISPEEQQVFLIETIAHILEAEIRTPSPSLMNKMCDLVKKRHCSKDVYRFLQSKQQAAENSRRKCTPHPRKSLSLKKHLLTPCAKTNDLPHHQSPSKANNQEVEKIFRIKGTPHPNKTSQLKKPLKRLENAASDLDKKKFNSTSDATFQSSTHSQVNLCSESNSLQLAHPQPKKYVSVPMIKLV